MTIKALFFTHRQADPDAICSAAALGMLLSLAFKQYHFDSRIVVPQGTSSLALSVSKKFRIEFEENVRPEDLEEVDLIVALDLGNPALIEPYLEYLSDSPALRILVDHHSSTSLDGQTQNGDSVKLFDESFIDSKATSTCEILTLGFQKQFLEKRISDILLTGLLFDSQHLGIATARTLEAALELVRSGSIIDDARNALRSKPDRSERLARIKSAQRIRFTEIGEYTILEGEVSSFQASVARMFIEIGGDVGIAFGKSDGEARVSVRSTQRFNMGTGLDLGQEMKRIAESGTFQGVVGGGHSTAASISGQNIDPHVLVDSLIAAIKQKLPQTW